MRHPCSHLKRFRFKGIVRNDRLAGAFYLFGADLFMPDRSTDIQTDSHRNTLRKQMRKWRQQQSSASIEEKSAAICQHICQSHFFKRSQRIALYYPQQGEVDLQMLLPQLWRENKQSYFPSLHPFQPRKLHFRPIRANTRLQPNRYNIPEPAQSRGTLFHPHELDLVLMPLVAFDDNGNRLGMGGGFYDRTFWAQTQSRHWQRPNLVGVAFDFQRVSTLTSKHWDVPLTHIITETGIYSYKQLNKDNL